MSAEVPRAAVPLVRADQLVCAVSAARQQLLSVGHCGDHAALRAQLAAATHAVRVCAAWAPRGRHGLWRSRDRHRRTARLHRRRGRRSWNWPHDGRPAGRRRFGPRGHVHDASGDCASRESMRSVCAQSRGRRAARVPLADQRAARLSGRLALTVEWLQLHAGALLLPPANTCTSECKT